MTSRLQRPFLRTAAAPRRAHASRRSGAGGTLLGLFIGLVLGLGLAAGVAFYLMKGGSPYQAMPGAKEVAKEPSRETARAGRGEPGGPEKPRFDFYKILPGAEEPKIQPRIVERSAPDKSTLERAASPDKAMAKADDRAAATERAAASRDKSTSGRERFWLQAGSFGSESDAEELKARLALAGWEAMIQPANVPEKGTRYRVRLGPYDNTEELNRVKNDLGKRGFDAAVIKN